MNEASPPGFFIEWWDGFYTRSIPVEVCGDCSAVVFDILSHRTVCPGANP